MSNQLKVVTKTISVSYDSIEEVVKSFEAYKTTIPANASNITTRFEVEQEAYSDSYMLPVLEVSYYVPKTEEDIKEEERRKRNLETQERARYLELKKKFENG
jgi:hypothetical protein